MVVTFFVGEFVYGRIHRNSGRLSYFEQHFEKDM